MRDVIFDDAANLIFEFERSGQEPYAILVLIDHNLGGIAKDVIAGPTVDRLTEAIARVPEEEAGTGELRVEEIGIADAAARCREALWRTEHTLEAPVSQDFKPQAAAVAAHMRVLPDDGEAYEPKEVSDSSHLVTAARASSVVLS